MTRILSTAGRTAATAALAATALGFAATAAAQQPPAQAPATTFAQGKAAAASRAQTPAQSNARGGTRYTDVASDKNFILENRGDDVLLQIEGDPEVRTLVPVPAQRGDVFFKDDRGQIVLRVTEQGNVVSYLANKTGAPADLVGYVAPLSAPAMTSSLNELRVHAAQRLTKLAGHEVTIFGTSEFSRNEAWAADALNNVIAGVERANGLAGKAATKLTTVRLVPAPAPSVAFKDGELVLGVNPNEEFGGRVSSEAITNALTAARSSG
ncbi:MAG TPA: DUF4908 domain-containing protein [Hyphomonadaceae bacterium]|nr:DUF4908 domain-containing protein [Hyphomonadaceae bacterium]